MTPQQLIIAGLAPAQAQTFAAPMTAACAKYGFSIATQAALVGECMVESQLFTRLEEALYYSNAVRIAAIFPREVNGLEDAATLVANPQGLANRVYAGRLGNGNEASADGWRYRGRGLLQLTGRANYAAAATALGREYVDSPQLLALPPDATLSAAWFFDVHGLAAHAEAGDIDAVTHAINPAMEQAGVRARYFRQALEALS